MNHPSPQKPKAVARKEVPLDLPRIQDEGPSGSRCPDGPLRPFSVSCQGDPRTMLYHATDCATANQLEFDPRCVKIVSWYGPGDLPALAAEMGYTPCPVCFSSGREQQPTPPHPQGIPPAETEFARAISRAEFDTAVGQGLAVVFFWEPYKRGCPEMREVLGKLEREDEFRDKVKFLKIRFAVNKAMAHGLAVRSIPDLLVFREGAQLARITALPTDQQMKVLSDTDDFRSWVKAELRKWLHFAC